MVRRFFYGIGMIYVIYVIVIWYDENFLDGNITKKSLTELYKTLSNDDINILISKSNFINICNEISETNKSIYEGEEFKHFSHAKKTLKSIKTNKIEELFIETLIEFLLIN